MTLPRLWRREGLSPRVRGTAWRLRKQIPHLGLSPRVRGNRLLA